MFHNRYLFTGQLFIAFGSSATCSGEATSSSGAWLHAHLEHQEEIFNEHPTYVYFKFGMCSSMGAMGCQVDDRLSLATESRCIPLGRGGGLRRERPGSPDGTLPSARHRLARDISRAIKKDRIDIYAGGSDRGNYVASVLDASGPAWVLVRR